MSKNIHFENAKLVEEKRTNNSTSFICEKVRRNDNNATLAIHYCRKSNLVEIIVWEPCKEEFVLALFFARKGGLL